MRGKEIRNLDKVRNGKHIFFYIDISLEDGYKLDNKDNRII